MSTDQAATMMISKVILFVAFCVCCCSCAGDAQPDMGSGSTSGTSCDSTPFMECANLGNILYPFWGSASCAASPSYVLSNCNTSSQHAYWDSFSAAKHDTGTLSSPPLVIILNPGPHPSIGLTWNLSFLNYDVCAPLLSSKNVSQYNFPASIDLTGFANSTFAFATPADFLYTTYLLFNCTSKASMSQLSSPYLYELIEESIDCTAYKVRCNISLTETSCINLRPHKELMLQHVMDELACSHFTFGLTASISYPPTITQWITGVVQLVWSNSECKQCADAGGICTYDPLSPAKFLYCECRNERIRNFNTQFSCHVCHGGLMQCKPILKICIAVAIPLLAIMLVLVAVHFRRAIRKGFLDFSMRLAPFAIRVLKKTLMHLQAFSYRPSHSFKDMDLEGLTERPIEYSYSAIASATKCFSSVVGEGGFGMVYKGTLPCAGDQGSGIQIAVKVLEMRSRHSKKQFLNEVVTIGRIHHLNVVRLLGFCMQVDHEMLVYEYVVNSSLDRWLFNDTNSGEEEKKEVLDWGQRYAIALGIARGLSYLHEECRHRTVHCDIKPQNILLDEEMCPKIADFGLARLMGREESQVVTIVKGTPGYMAPEFWMGGESRLSTKFDVYSYGMVLLEIMSGRRNFAPHGCCFPALAFEAAMQGDFETILDARLNMTTNTSDHEDDAQSELQQSQIRTATFVALWCIQDQPSSRPCMSEVVQYLEGVAAVSQNPPQPAISISTTSILSHSSTSNAHHQHDFTPISVGR